MVVDFNGKKIISGISKILIKHFINWGNVNDDLNFEYEDSTLAYCGCGATLKGEFWYFGSAQRARYFHSNFFRHLCFHILQLSKIVGCKLTRQGSLPFTANYPSCNTFLHPTPKVLICFGNYPQICHTYVFFSRYCQTNSLIKFRWRKLWVFILCTIRSWFHIWSCKL